MCIFSAIFITIKNDSDSELDMLIIALADIPKVVATTTHSAMFCVFLYMLCTLNCSFACY